MALPESFPGCYLRKEWTNDTMEVHAYAHEHDLAVEDAQFHRRDHRVMKLRDVQTMTSDDKTGQADQIVRENHSYHCSMACDNQLNRGC